MGKQLTLFDLPEIWMEVRDHEFLKELIDDSPYTLRELSTRIGWKSHGYLNKLRSGEKNTLATEPALRMAKLLGVRVERLFVLRESGDRAQTVGAQSKTRAAKSARKDVA
jgi:hypothetical protein